MADVKTKVKAARSIVDDRIGAILAEVAQLASITADLMVDHTDHGSAAGEQLALKIGALADAGRQILDDGPAVRGDLTDWLAPWLKEEGDAASGADEVRA